MRKMIHHEGHEAHEVRRFNFPNLFVSFVIFVVRSDLLVEREIFKRGSTERELSGRAPTGAGYTIIPAPTVLLVASSIKMNEPVARLRA